MADSKITGLAATTTLLSTDILPVVTDPGGSPVTKKMTFQNAIEAIFNHGWIPIAQTLTYASATTVTIPGDYTAWYQKGDIFTFTNPTVKYFYVTATSTFGGGNTTVTLSGGSDFAVANSVITLPSYSKNLNAQGFPVWFNYPANPGGFSVPPGQVARFMIVGRKVTVMIYPNAGGTSNATTFTETAPVTATAIGGGAFWCSVGCNAQNNGAPVVPVAVISSSTATINVWNGTYGTAWTNVGTKYATFTLDYEI